VRRDSQSTKPAYSDEQLVLEALDDSHPAFEQLIEQYQHRVLRTIASIVSDEQAVQDVAQETFLSAWSNLAKLKEKQKFGRWLNQIAVSFSKRWLRDQRKHHDSTVSLEENVVVLTQELRYQHEKLRHEVWEAIDELAESYREAVILHYITGYSYKEISEMLSVPVSTVRGRLQQARDQLRKEFLGMVSKLHLEIDSKLHGFLKTCKTEQSVHRRPGYPVNPEIQEGH
jgi:RNA polymerase sigma-70 factor (ECF subfamily)